MRSESEGAFESTIPIIFARFISFLLSLQSVALMVWLRFRNQPSPTQQTQYKLAAVLIWPKHVNTIE